MKHRHVLGALALAVALGPAARAEEQAPKPKGCCQQRAAAQHDAAGAGLDAKLSAMNAAQGGDKVDAIAAVVNELVAQHRAMHAGGCCAAGCPMMGHGEHAPAEGAAP